ncbi:MAG: ArsR/SmtB family transcription factor [Clostridium sp.]|uniref:ArsR/SmtB family transcription factor n=1 Tax=Clostridium sp. TaxID=1506 RepID=UPI003F3321E4
MITPDISTIASIFSDKSRAIMLVELLGGARTTGELAKASKIKPQTATYHLSKMVKLNIIKNNKYGKNSYYKIENEEIAKVLEMLMQLSKEPKISSLKESVQSEQIRFARLCYDHIAGRLGVRIFDKLIDEEYIEIKGKSIFITDKGKLKFKKVGFTIEDKKYSGELCRDWSERSNHISGEIGSMIYSNLLKFDLIEKDKETRKLFLTNKGREFLKEEFDLSI